MLLIHMVLEIMSPFASVESIGIGVEGHVISGHRSALINT
jgi:hypothetical protein